MSFRHTASLLVLALALASYIWWFENPFKPQQIVAEVDRRLFPELDIHTVSSIALKQGENPVAIEAKQNGWEITTPIQYPAEPTRVAAFLETLSKLSYQSALPVDNSSSNKEADLYGLQSPRTIVSLVQGNRTLQLEIGSDSPGNITFVKRAESPQVYTLLTDALEPVDTDPDTWRDPRVFSYPSSEIRSIHVASPANQATLTRDSPQEDWIMQSPHRGARLDKQFITFFLQQLTELRVDSFHPRLDLPAQITLQLGLTGNRTYTLELLAPNETDPSLIWARLPDSGSTIAMPQVFASELVDPAKTFRSSYVFDPGFLFDTIEFEGLESFTLHQDNTTGQWSITHPEKMPADPALVAQLTRQLVELRITDFITDDLTDENLFGLDTPARSITLSLSNAGQNGIPDQAPLRVRFGSNVRGHLMTHRSDEQSVYAVPFGAVSQLPSQAFKLRTRTLWPQKNETTTAIRVIHEGATLREWQQSDGQWQVGGKSLGDIESAAFDALVSELLAVRVAAWTSVGAESEARYGMGKIAALEIVTTNEDQALTRRIRFGSKTARGNRYAATELDGRVSIFEFPKDFFVKLNQVLNLDQLPTE